MRTTPSFWFILKNRWKGRPFLYEFYFKGKNTVDIGCGEGEFLSHNPEQIYGVDTNARVIEQLGEKGYHVTLADGGKMPYPDNTFEMAHCHNVIEHLDISQAYNLLTEAARVLKPGGQLVLSSEMVTKKFWETFGHVKPYPPKAVIKLLRPDSREEFEGISTLEYVDVFYIGDHYHNKLAYLISFALGYFTPLMRREYFLVLRKK
jgi:ubiquinone/menaquinone biosynthesis C-methylase UbiE